MTVQLCRPFDKNLQDSYAEKRIRRGKTAKAKANGHQPYRKNRRIWTGNTAQDPQGKWVKA